MQGIIQAFPIGVTNQQIDIYGLMGLEGFPYGQNLNYSGVFAVAQTPIGSIRCSPNETLWIESISVEADFPVNIVLFNEDSNGLPTSGNSVISATRYRVGTFGTQVFTYRQFVSPSHIIRASLELGDGTSNGRIIIGINGWRIASDRNFRARYTLFTIGDSITRGLNTPPNTILTDTYQGALLDYMTLNGFDVRWVAKALGGITTTTGEFWRKYRWLMTSGEVAFYALGTNDAVQGISSSVYLANLGNAIYQLRYRFKKIIVFGPPPLNDDTQENNAVSVRANFRAYVQGLSNPNIQFCSLAHNYITDPTYSNPPSPSNPANYSFNRLSNTLPSGFYTATTVSNTTGPGDGIHPNINGNQAIWINALQPYIIQNPLIP